MAIEFTPSGLQAQLQLVATAIDSSDYVGARKALAKALAVLTGLPIEIRARAEMVRYREDYSAMERALTAAEAADNGNDPRRLIKTGFTHGR